LKHFAEALKIHREIGHKQAEASDLGNIGIILKLCGKSNDALKHLNESLEIFEKIGMKREADIISSHILEICLDDR